MYPDSSPDYDSSSSCSTTSFAGDTLVCSQFSPDSLSNALSTDGTSGKDVFAKTGAPSCTFVPTVTAISTSPDLQWMVQPTVLTSDTPSLGRNKPSKAHGTVHSSHRVGGCKRQSTGKKEHKKQPSSEDERRKIRRERNKIAAAKCRNRRRELTDTLQAETDKLEDNKIALETEIANLLKEKERLEQILAFHQPACKLSSVDGDIENMLQGPPASPNVLSIPDHNKLPEGSAAIESPLMQDMEAFAANISATAILGNSDILLCATATIEEEPMKDLRGDDLEDLVPSLELTNTSKMAVSVPDIDLEGPFCVSDWETLYKSVENDLETLSIPFVSSSPTCSSYRSAFSLNCSETDFLGESLDSLKGSLGESEFTKDSLYSTTLLAL